MQSAARQALLALYAAPDPAHPSQAIPGYDQEHAERTTRIVLLLAHELGLDPKWLADLEATCLLHDLGRVGMDPTLFGRIFTLAEAHGIPVRIRPFLARYPDVTEANAPKRFLELLSPHLQAAGLAPDADVKAHIAMRMDFKGQLRHFLAQARPLLATHGIVVHPWMEAVMLYYYYPDGMRGQSPDVRLMGEMLVACENFEAYNNARRGRDYYGRTAEQLKAVFSSLDRFVAEGLVSERVMTALRRLTASGKLDAIVIASRGLPPGTPLPAADLAFQRTLA